MKIHKLLHSIECVCVILIFYFASAYGNDSNQDNSSIVAQPHRSTPQKHSSLKYAILAYSRSDPTTIQWMDERFEYRIGGGKPLSDEVKWLTYYDIYGPSGMPELLKFKDWAVENAIKPEEVLLHSKIDYTSSANPSWKLMDKFDNFEGANGVLHTSDEEKFTDLTADAYSKNIIWKNSIYIGYEEPFDQINLMFSSSGKEVSCIWEFWNGTEWTPLNINDGTSNLSTNGQIYFSPPPNWARKIINSSRNKYFIRCRIAKAIVFPVSSSIKGDSWLNDKSNACRGWNSEDKNIINSGELTYNPSPQQVSTAKFPYQARITYWSDNHFVANPGNKQKLNGKLQRPWAQFLAYRINQLLASLGCAGVMGDDGARSPANEKLQVTNTDFTGKWDEESLAKYIEMMNILHSSDPSTLVGLNCQSKDYVMAGNWNLAEFNTSAYWSLGRIESDSGLVMSYDDYLPKNNPKGVVGVLIYADTVDTVPFHTAAWDRSNRGPVVALAKHLIAQNQNTVFSYYSKGGYIYSETDEVILDDNSVIHQAKSPVPDISKIKRWATWFPAMGVDFGQPDVKGYKEGNRDLKWSIQPDGLNIARRDYTKAVVFWRGSTYNTPDDAYVKYSTPIDLGGTFYPLLADGTRGPAVTALSLRAGEGTILMKTID